MALLRMVSPLSDLRRVIVENALLLWGAAQIVIINFAGEDDVMILRGTHFIPV